MILRNFIYLDNKMLDDYLSTMEGYLIESEELIENKMTKTSGKAKVTVLEGSREADIEKGSIKKVIQTSAGKFQKLYELLESNSMLQYLEVFDSKIWNCIKRNEIIEVPGLIRITKVFNMLNSVGNVSPLIDIMQDLGQTSILDSKSKDAMKGLKALTELDLGNEIPIIIEFEENNLYKVAAMLMSEHLNVDLSKLEGNVTIIGKVQKIIGENEKYKLFSMTKGFEAIIESKNREQRRKNNLKKNSNDEMSDYLVGPAFIIIPLAIFR